MVDWVGVKNCFVVLDGVTFELHGPQIAREVHKRNHATPPKNHPKPADVLIFSKGNLQLIRSNQTGPVPKRQIFHENQKCAAAYNIDRCPGIISSES